MFDYIFMRPLDKICDDHHQHSVFFQDINQILDGKYHPCPSMIVLSWTTFLPSQQHRLVRVWCYTLSSLLSSSCSSLPWNINISYVLNVVRISPPLENSWYSDASHHHNSSIGPRVEWTLLWEFNISSNLATSELMDNNSNVECWLLNFHSDVGRATQPIFRVPLSTNI